MMTAEDIQNRTNQLKEVQDCVKVVQGDIMKFGRVRFRVKKLVLNNISNLAEKLVANVPSNDIESRNPIEMTVV